MAEQSLSDRLYELESQAVHAKWNLERWCDRHKVAPKDVYEEFLAGRLAWTDELESLVTHHEQAWDAYEDALRGIRRFAGRAG